MNWLLKLLSVFKKKKEVKKIETPVNVEAPIEEKVETVEKKFVVGIDIYHGDIISDWATLSKEIDFIFIKCTEGDWRDDPKFKEYREMAKKYGIPCGHYHFYRSDKDPIEQANDFLRNVKEIQVGELPPVCDWETEDDEEDGLDIDEVKIFQDEIEKKLGMKPIIYSGYYFIKDKNLPKEWANYPLWLADYNISKQGTRIPLPWKKQHFLQTTDKAIVKGVKKPCDYNYFNGTIEELKALCKKG